MNPEGPGTGIRNAKVSLPSRSALPAALIADPTYTGFALIGTCHFQNLANILEAQGFEDALRRICLSWGFKWNGKDGILYGGTRWIELANRVYGLDLRRESLPSWEQATAFEKKLLADGLPSVVEVDAFYLPSSPYRGKEHAVNTVTLLAQGVRYTMLLDATNNPVPVQATKEDYRKMRASECAGRVEPYVLYASRPSSTKEFAPDNVALALQEALAQHWTEDLALLADYLAWVDDTDEPINVCRVAAERTYLGFLFKMLGENFPNLASFSRAFSSLAERWYLLHMLTVNEGGVSQRQRPRILRLLRELSEWESSLEHEVTRALKVQSERVRLEISHG